MWQIWFFPATAGVTALAVWQSDQDYRTRSRLTWISVLLISGAILLPHLLIGFSRPVAGGQVPLLTIGWVLAGSGIVMCVVGMAAFRSALMVLGQDPRKLVKSGPYRWSRNPQYVGYGLAPIGFALQRLSVTAVAGVALYWLVVHCVILVEEDHLRRAFGDEYRVYCQTTSRYLGRPRGRV